MPASILDFYDIVSSALFTSTADQIIEFFTTETKEAYYILNKNVLKNARDKPVVK